MVQGLLQLGGSDALFAEQEFAEPNSHGCVVVAESVNVERVRPLSPPPGDGKRPPPRTEPDVL
jgi:hypothetical protein